MTWPGEEAQNKTMGSRTKELQPSKTVAEEGLRKERRREGGHLLSCKLGKNVERSAQTVTNRRAIWRTDVGRAPTEVGKARLETF